MLTKLSFLKLVVLFVAVFHATTTLAALTEDEKAFILYLHNVYRSTIANGLVNDNLGLNYPIAGNMNELKWDHSLAAFAQDYVDACEFDESDYHNSRNERYLNSNANYSEIAIFFNHANDHENELESMEKIGENGGFINAGSVNNKNVAELLFEIIIIGWAERESRLTNYNDLYVMRFCAMIEMRVNSISISMLIE